MNLSPQTVLLLLIAAVVTFALFRLLQHRGKPTRTVVHKTTTEVQLSIKISRPPGVPTGFPTLRASNPSAVNCTLERVEVKAVRNDGKEASAQAEVSPGTPIPPEPGVEVNLTEAFRRVASELCGWSNQKAQVKYRVAAQCALAGMTIPIEEPLQSAYLSSEGLEDSAEPSNVES